MSQPNRNPESDPKDSLIERAIRAFESGGLQRPNPADVAGTMPRPAEMLQPQAQPEVAPPASVAPVAAPAPQLYSPEPAAQAFDPAPQVYAPAPAPAPVYQQAAAPRGSRFRVDASRLHAEGLIAPGSGITAHLEEFRIIKRQLLSQAQDMRRRGGTAASQRVLITSALPGEGKSFCAANLALVFAAEKDSDVLIVDFDSARNSVLSSFGLPAGPGLIDALANPSVDVRDCIMHTDIPGLSVLPGGRSTSSDNEYLSSARAQEVLDLLTEDAPNRIVLFDSPPALAASLPAELAKIVGQVVLVVKAEGTSQGAVQDAVSLVSACPNVQLLLNGVQFSPSGRRFGTYYK
ncbi:MAG: hypothetical protein RLY97_784 [Pseudomonadota bacterium]